MLKELMSYKYTAVIIEPRKHKALEFVIENACDCLSEEWKILFFHGINNVEYSEKIVAKLNRIYNDRIQLVNSGVKDLNKQAFDKFLATRTIFYDFIDTEMFLVFHTDSLIIKKNAHLINEYLNYDYVGAPWEKNDFAPTKNCDFIGNGGLSLRRKSKMFEIMDKIPFNGEGEDLYFCTNYDNIKVNKPDYEKSKRFSVEQVFSEITFACHKYWAHEKLYNHPYSLKDIYPEIGTLEGLQGVEE